MEMKIANKMYTSIKCVITEKILNQKMVKLDGIDYRKQAIDLHVMLYGISLGHLNHLLAP